MGTTGAAIATVIGQAFGALAGFLFHHKYNKEVNIRLSDCRPDGHIILDIYRIGFPSILMVGIGSLTNYLMNRILMAFTSTAVALYGAYFKLQSFFFMPVFGLNNGIVPIVGYNYGARKKERIYRTIRYGVLYAVCILAVGLLLFEAIPGVLLQAFSPSEHMLAIGIPALRKIAIHFPIAAFCIVGGSVCQALGKSLYSFFTSVLRQVVALIPAAYLLSLTGNVGNVWWCFPIAEVVSACATAFFPAPRAAKYGPGADARGGAMKEFIIGRNDAGQRLDRFVSKAAPLIPESLLQKTLRKKDIKINGRPAKGETRLAEGDTVRVYLPDDFFEAPREENAWRKITAPRLDIVYEDENILLVDKAGRHSGGSGAEYAHRQYPGVSPREGRVGPGREGFAPALCNRIDCNNTGGIVIAAKKRRGAAHHG